MMKLFESNLILTLALFSCIAAAAQDKVLTVNGYTYTTTVKSIDRHMVHIAPVPNGETEDITKLPRNYIRSITFPDGYVLNFTPDGEIVRETLVDAPTVKFTGGNFLVENLVKLNRKEVRLRLGEDLYNQKYRPAKVLEYTGIFQIVAGGSILAATSWMDDKDVVFQNTKGGFIFRRLIINTAPALNWLSDNRVIYNHGWINPYIVGAQLFGAAGIVVGAVNTGRGWHGLKASLDENPVIPTLSRARVRLWTGTGLCAAGAGMMAFGIKEMADHREWAHAKFSYGAENQEGEMPTVGAILTFAGSLLFHYGLSDILESGSRLRAGRNAPTLSMGFTPGGYGLSMRF